MKKLFQTHTSNRLSRSQKLSSAVVLAKRLTIGLDFIGSLQKVLFMDNEDTTWLGHKEMLQPIFGCRA